jgi:protein-tyrosine phosphatase
MFGLFKKRESSAASGTQQNNKQLLVADMHSHLLPGIDDGSPDVETSMLLIDGLYKHGFRKLICTPHIYRELYFNTPETIEAAYQLLLPEVKKKYPDVQLSYAAEYFLDDYFDSLIEQKSKLLTIKDNNVLVEISFMAPPMDLKQKLFAMQMEGYMPILAHPERYGFMLSQRQMYDDLLDAGCTFQLNLLSISGYYGKPSEELANYLLSKKAVRYLGTDMHHVKHLEALSHPKIYRMVNDLRNSGLLLNDSL